MSIISEFLDFVHLFFPFLKNKPYFILTETGSTGPLSPVTGQVTKFNFIITNNGDGAGAIANICLRINGIWVWLLNKKSLIVFDDQDKIIKNKSPYSLTFLPKESKELKLVLNFKYILVPECFRSDQIEKKELVPSFYSHVNLLKENSRLNLLAYPSVGKNNPIPIDNFQIIFLTSNNQILEGPVYFCSVK